MSTDDEEARRKRADALRAKIKGINSGQNHQPDQDMGGNTSRHRDELPVGRPSPREFIEDRMRDMDKREQDRPKKNDSD